MTNHEKYKKGEETTKAFVKFCRSKECKKCPIFAQGSESLIVKCFCDWLDMEAKENQDEIKN